MKKINLLLLIILLTFAVQAQQKILFDNTKNEQAGNADWIPDANSRYPSPAQSGITGNPLPNSSGTTETFWSGALSSWGVEMVKRGFIIETLPSTGSITYGNTANAQDLKNYKVFVVCEPNNKFSSGEKTALINFVQNGGGLFVIADHPIADRDNDGCSAVCAWNDFLSSVPSNGFGFTFSTTDDVTQAPCTNIPNLPGDPLLHGIAGDVAGIEYHGSATMIINKTNNPSIKAVAFDTGVSQTGSSGVICAYATYGNGKIVAMTDSSIPEDKTANSGTTYDGWIQPIGGLYNGHNGRLVSNATIWLATSTITGLNESTNFSAISISPNPAQNEIFFELSNPIQKNALSIIYTITGRIISQTIIADKQSKINIDGLPSGYYFLKIVNGKEIHNQKFIKE